MNATRRHASSTRSGTDGSRLWYAPHPHLKTAPAAREACKVAEWVSSGRLPDPELNEQSLFVAMHTCAYRAYPRAGRSATPPAERQNWVAHWQTLRSHIVERNLGLAHSMLGRFKASRADHDDLLSEAMFALVRAVDRYNPWRGYRFSTYACNVIIRALMRRCRHQLLYQRRFPLLDAECSDQPEKSAADTEVYLERLRRAVRCNAGKLTDVEAKVLARRFPANASSPMTFREISRVVGLSRERIRQIEGVALSKLRLALMGDPVLQ